MEVKTLEGIPIQQLTSCFNLAFSDYFVKFNATEEYLSDRWKRAGVDYSLSPGVFDGDKLVGFIVNAVRKWKGKKTAFNCGTGVIPSHRGNQLTQKMYEFFVPKVKSAGVECLALEVIQENQKAVHIYQKMGLEIERGLNCFSGKIAVNPLDEKWDDLNFKKLEHPNWQTINDLSPFEPAWENNSTSIKVDVEKYSFYEVDYQNKKVAYLIISHENGAIAQFGIHPNFQNKDIGEFLFYQLSEDFESVKMNNVDDQKVWILELLNRCGLKNSINQYEMVSYL